MSTETAVSRRYRIGFRGRSGIGRILDDLALRLQALLCQNRQSRAKNRRKGKSKNAPHAGNLAPAREASN